VTNATALFNPASRAALLQRYQGAPLADRGYATVRDFCDSVDHLRPLCQMNGDLKDVQRPWTVKAVLSAVPAGSRVLEIGGGIPLAAGALAELGYDVTLVDPYDGAGNGPVEYEHYVAMFPNVRIVRSLFTPDLTGFEPGAFDAICSVSVLEHVHGQHLLDIFAGIRRFLRPGGASIHCVDSVVQGEGTEFHTRQLETILAEQRRLAGATGPSYAEIVARLCEDLETFYLSAHGHQLWRGGTPYDQFPFRKVVSIQSCVVFAGA
jgi:SAM-dependent methyltransferase